MLWHTEFWPSDCWFLGRLGHFVIPKQASCPFSIIKACKFAWIQLANNSRWTRWNQFHRLSVSIEEKCAKTRPCRKQKRSETRHKRSRAACWLLARSVHGPGNRSLSDSCSFPASLYGPPSEDLSQQIFQNPKRTIWGRISAHCFKIETKGRPNWFRRIRSFFVRSFQANFRSKKGSKLLRETVFVRLPTVQEIRQIYVSLCYLNTVRPSVCACFAR